MPRSGNIKDPTKVTLYMPKDIVDQGKRFASNTGGSLSQLVTDLVESRVGETFQYTVLIDKDLKKKLEKKASKQKITIKELIPILLSENFGN
tara:strand:+ start:288 stop:563 length:276 start_codon:yes stop_codon:yes gene_type:complete